jgi:hypothetical protein
MSSGWVARPNPLLNANSIRIDIGCVVHICRGLLSVTLNDVAQFIAELRRRFIDIKNYK